MKGPITQPAIPEWAEPLATRFAGRFLLLSHIGSGGMGEVYAAYDPELDRKLAVKLLRDQSGLAVSDLRSEGRALARLDHPNVVKIYDVLRLEGELAIAMELVDGSTLGDWLDLEERPWRQVLDVFLGAGRGLAAAHEAGVIHRDFKPSNIMVATNGAAKVLDFGIARSSGTDQADGLGTPAYSAPERLRSLPADARSDQFSFCVVFFEALFGSHPFFDAFDYPGSLARLREGRLLNAAKTPTLPNWLTRVVLRGLNVDPAARFPEMRALLSELDRGLKRPRRLAMGLAATFLLASGGLAGLWLAPTGAKVCGSGESRLAGIWDDARKAEINRALLASNPRPAPEILRTITSSFDRFAAEWLTLEKSACEATLRGEQSEQVLDLRMLCLERGLAELKIVSAALVSPDQQTLARPDEALRALPLLSDCRKTIETAILAPLPQNGEVRARVSALDSEVAQASTRLTLEQKIEPAALEDLLFRAQALDYQPLVGRAHLTKARERVASGVFLEAAASLEKALEAAIAGEDRFLQAQVYGQMLELHGFYLSDHEKAQSWKRLVEASIRGMGARFPEVEFQSQVDLIRYALTLGDLTETMVRGRRALQIGEKIWGTEDLRLARVYINLGSAAEPQFEAFEGEGLAHLEKALAIIRRQLGSWHPQLAAPLANMAQYHATRGRYEAALDLARQSREILFGFFSDGGVEAAFPTVLEAQLLTVLDRPRAALDQLRLAETSLAKYYDDAHPMVVYLHLTQARALILEERLAEADRELDVVERLAGNFPPQHELHFDLLETRAQLLLESGRADLAFKNYEQACKTGTDLKLSNDRLAAAVGGRGEASLALGRQTAALVDLEKALAISKPGQFPLQIARLRWVLARALSVSERVRARELATQALGALPGGSSWTKNRRREIETWLAETRPAENQ